MGYGQAKGVGGKQGWGGPNPRYGVPRLLTHSPIYPIAVIKP